MSNMAGLAQRAMDEGRGVMRLAPNWVPRSFCVPGRRIKLHPGDYYVLGGARGGIDERWFASTTPADNGPLTGRDEGLSAIVASDAAGETILLRDAVAELGAAIVGDRLWRDHGGWPMFSKFFNHGRAAPFITATSMLRVSARPANRRRTSRPVNNHGGRFPRSSAVPGTTRSRCAGAGQFRPRRQRISALSATYRLEVGTGWDVRGHPACAGQPGTTTNATRFRRLCHVRSPASRWSPGIAVEEHAADRSATWTTSWT
jgi:hypothetical protein